MVTLPGVEGEMGIYPNHVPLMTQIVPGEIIARKDGQDYFLAVGEGFVEITGDRVAILTDMAIKPRTSTKPRLKKPAAAPRLASIENLSDEEMANVRLLSHTPSCSSK